MKWINASARLPEKKTWYYIFRKWGNPRTAKSIYFDRCPDITKRMQLPIEQIEWLDETPEPLLLNAIVAYKLLKIKEALIKEDYQDAYHQLYSIADPDFKETEPWQKLENIAKGICEPWPENKQQTNG